MTYQDLQDAVIALRFNEFDRDLVKRELNTRYAVIWNRADWIFKHVAGYPVAIVAGSVNPALPADFAKLEALYDEQGAALDEISPDKWDGYFNVPAIGRGRPWAFKIVDRELYLGQTPSSSVTFTMDYIRRLAHVDGTTGAETAGAMAQDDDQPIWEAEYDDVLVYDATIACQKLKQDPTWRDLVDVRDELYAAMEQDLVGGSEPSAPRQWGRVGC